LAKARVLGAGYQCGGKRFKSVAKMMAGVELTEEEAIATIQAYRESNPKIVSLWNRLQRDFYWAYQTSEPYELRLPSGRILRYENLTRASDNLRAQVEINGNPVNFFGGKLTENLVQATARDVFCEGILRLYAADYPLLFHVHDEYVMEVEAGEAESCAEEIKKIIEEPVPWMPECPIGAKVKVLERYKK
jgi:DNA polymerase